MFREFQASRPNTNKGPYKTRETMPPGVLPRDSREGESRKIAKIKRSERMSPSLLAPILGEAPPDLPGGQAEGGGEEEGLEGATDAGDPPARPQAVDRRREEPGRAEGRGEM